MMTTSVVNIHRLIKIRRKGEQKNFSYGENSEFKNIHIYCMSLLTVVIMLYIAAQKAGWTTCPSDNPMWETCY